MKTFIYKETAYYRKHNNRELTIYQVKKNTPCYVGTLEYTTGSTKGAKAEVLQFLIDNKYIPKKYYYSSECSWRGAGYYGGIVVDKYKIIEI